MKRIRLLLVLCAVIVMAVGAEASERPRNRVRSVVEAANDGFSTVADFATNNLFLNAFPKEEGNPINSQVTGNLGLSVLELYLASKLYLKFYKTNPMDTPIHDIKFSTLFSGFVLFVDGVARAYISVNGHEATIFPLYSFAESKLSGIELDVSSSFTEKEYSRKVKESANMQLSATALEAFMGVVLKVVAEYSGTLDPKVKRVLKIAGPALFLDGMIRFGSAASSMESQNLFAPLDFVKDRFYDGAGLRQPVSENVGGIGSGR